MANKRSNVGIALQLKELTSLSQVKEELSGLSRETDTYTTPNNEPNVEEQVMTYVQGDDIQMTDVFDGNNISVKEVIAAMEETKV